MTSGIFHVVPLDQIVVKRDDRQRRELQDIDVLADSIRRLGLIHPLVVTRNYELVAGERRYTACKSLGWETVAVQYVDELSPSYLMAIEFEENIKRQDISWQDQIKALSNYHNLRVSETPNWSYTDTAEAIGLSRQHISRCLLVNEELEKGNKLVTEAKRLSTALGIAERARERHDQALLDKFSAGLGSVTVQEPLSIESILVEDFNKWVHTPISTKFNLIHCDFPYGIEADSFNQGSAGSHGGYEDTKETWMSLMRSLETATKKITSPSCHLMFWFSMRKADERLYEPTAYWLESMGWNINPLPLIWMKSDGAGILPDPERGPRQIYETCLLGSKGDRKIVRAVSNAYAAPTVRERHMSEKPESMLRHFFSMLVDQNTVMLDPTCGSGSSLRAAESIGAKYVLGLEINPEFASLAKTALDRARKLQEISEGQNA